MPISYDTLLNESEEFYKKQQEQALADKNATFDRQLDNLNQNYDLAVKNANSAYEDKYRENAIQKLINERQVSENMANMGTSNSGLSRTQATATQLSYANQKAALDRQKQQQEDSLERERASSLTDIESNRRSELDSVSQYYTGLKQDMANSRYNTDVEAETSRINATVEAQNKLDLAELNNTAEYNKALALKQLEYEYETAKANAEKTSQLYTFTGQQKYDDAGNLINIYKDSSGKEYPMKEGYNPYTGADNSSIYAYEKEQYGFFKNGYQPKGIKGYGPVKAFDSINITGKPQNVWRTSTRSGYQYWIWSGRDNKYISVVQKNGEWVIA